MAASQTPRGSLRNIARNPVLAQPFVPLTGACPDLTRKILGLPRKSVSGSASASGGPRISIEDELLAPGSTSRRTGLLYCGGSGLETKSTRSSSSDSNLQVGARHGSSTWSSSMWVKKLFARPVTAHPVLVEDTIEKLAEEGTARTKSSFSQPSTNSSVDTTQRSQDFLPMVSFVGESNVGKSSLLNKLLNGRELAVSSSRAGRTRHLFRFDVADTLRMVDLPGYGYAEVHQVLKEKWRKMLLAFCRQQCVKENLRCVLCLVDATVGIQPEDEQVWRKTFAGYPKLLVLTKIDLLTQAELHSAVAAAGYRIEEMNRPCPFDALLGNSAVAPSIGSSQKARSVDFVEDYGSRDTDAASVRTRLYGPSGRGILRKALENCSRKEKMEFPGGAESPEKEEDKLVALPAETTTVNKFSENEAKGLGPANILSGIHCVSAKEGWGISELQRHIAIICGLKNPPSCTRSPL
ncbi:unnamed protein product [Amoebophrya sp. A25]|nr:unnamed protein product [Amoebophrya sp. A25]|eukprot:GSA25T00000655001.1